MPGDGCQHQGGAGRERAAAGSGRRLPGVEFHKASAARLPYVDGTFTHVWSQAPLYHVPDRDRVLGEIHRVLAQEAGW
jgi:ubiquinone/menaquinone biosynthesis C-methylase UbiE